METTFPVTSRSYKKRFFVSRCNKSSVSWQCYHASKIIKSKKQLLFLNGSYHFWLRTPGNQRSLGENAHSLSYWHIVAASQKTIAIAIALVARSQLWSPCGCMVNSCLQIVCNWLQSSSENVKMWGLFLALSRQSSELYTEIFHTSLFTLDQGSHFLVPLQSKIAERGESDGAV